MRHILFFLCYFSFLYGNNFDLNQIKESNPEDRCKIIYMIGEERDIKNIQILIQFLKDDEKILWRNPEIPWGFTVTTPGWESAKGILKIGKESIPFLINFIEKKEKGYEKAIWILGELRSKELVPLILKMKPISGDIQFVSVIALGKIKDESSLPYLISSLDNYWNRIHTIEAIESFGKKAIPYLVKAIQDKEVKSIIKAYCCYLISKITQKEELKEKIPFEIFIELLKDKDINVRRKVSEAIIGIINEENNKILIDILKKEKDWIVKSNIIEAIGKTKDKKTIDEIIDFLEEPDITIKIKVCEAVGETGDKSKGKYILKEVNSDYWYLRKIVIEAIGKIKDEDSYKKIIEFAENEKNIQVIESILWAGGEIGKEEFSDFIISYISHSEPTIRKTSYNSIIKIGTPSLPSVVKFLNENVEKLNWEILNMFRDLMAEIGKENIGELIKLLGNQNWKIQVISSGSLAKIGEKSIPYLKEAIKSKNNTIKYRTIQTLGSIQTKESIEVLMDFIKEEKDINLKKEAVNSLGKIKDKKSIEFLISLLKDENLKNIALDNLEKLTNKYFGDDIEKWKEYVEKEIK